jgi:hypothetical protein
MIAAQQALARQFTLEGTIFVSPLVNPDEKN